VDLSPQSGSKKRLARQHFVFCDDSGNSFTKETDVISQAEHLKNQYNNLIAEFESAFPGIQSPDPSWWALWLSKYAFSEISATIQKLAQHPLKSKFTVESCGRAISSLLRAEAIKQAIPAAPVKAVKS
jgi:hypothetical protein